MLVGLSLLTAVALRRFTAEVAAISSPLELCPRTPADCPAYDAATEAAVLTQLHTVFAGAAIAAGLAAVAALILLRTGRSGPRPTLTGSTAARWPLPRLPCLRRRCGGGRRDSCGSACWAPARRPPERPRSTSAARASAPSWPSCSWPAARSCRSTGSPSPCGGTGSRRSRGAPCRPTSPHLRRRLQPGSAARTRSAVIVSEGAGYAVRLPPDAVDFWRFEQLLERGRGRRRRQRGCSTRRSPCGGARR